MEHELSDENKATGAHEPPTNVALSNKRRSFRSLLVKSSWAQTVGFKVFGNKGKRDDNTIGKRNDNNQTDVIRTTNNARPEFFSRKPKRSTHTALAEPLAELGRLDKKTTNSEWKTVTLDGIPD
ncbi:uncharacterized protein CTRU02_213526 [Colletotrichum truncatum]|uniref:Uncharacterized protein n=1 Tax=Colletotrichum truncatum TaxID=5467 RepID=A0ACC3YG25_COLTU